MEIKVFEQKIEVAQALLEDWRKRILEVTPKSEQLCEVPEKIMVAL